MMNSIDANLLNALGWAVLHFFWQGTLIALIAAAVLRGLHRQSAGARYAVACGALALCLMIFVGTFVWLLDSGKSVTAAALPQIVEAEPTNWIPLIAIGWALGVGLMLVRFTRHWMWSRRLRTRAISPPSVEWQRVFENLKTELAVSRPVKLLRSGLAETPMVVGWLAPVVLVPAGAFVSLNPDQLRAVLAHELAHIRRHDHWVNLLQGMIEIVLFFHPATWWLSKQIHAEREYCCDDISAHNAGNPRVLAEALAQLELLRRDVPVQALAANGGSLLKRVRRLLLPREQLEEQNTNPNATNTKERTMKTKTLGTLTIGLLLAGGLLFAQADDPQPRKPAPTDRQRAAKQLPQPPERQAHDIMITADELIIDGKIGAEFFGDVTIRQGQSAGEKELNPEDRLIIAAWLQANDARGVPYLSDLPEVGRLFRTGKARAPLGRIPQMNRHTRGQRCAACHQQPLARDLDKDGDLDLRLPPHRFQPKPSPDNDLRREMEALRMESAL